METIAVYWEPVIRVYGFDTIFEAVLVKMDFPTASLEEITTYLESQNTLDVKYLLVLMQQVTPQMSQLSILIKNEFSQTLHKNLKNTFADRESIKLEIIEPVEILFYHGPHFQDRYGIAHATFKELDLKSLNLFLVGCTGTSVYLVTGAGQAELAKTMLAESFVVPK